jgi:Na+-transporting NADH:ubiquinone oxidoreductase subunit C
MLNKESNLYIVIFSALLVMVMGTGLAVINQVTRPSQELNEALEKKQNILASIGIEANRKEAGDLFSKIIVGAVAIDTAGNVMSSNIDEVFSINLADELKKKPSLRRYPIFIADHNGQKKYIVAMRGKGLWDAIWGFVAVEADGATISGATFDHKSETPGLGAEIKEKPFQQQFPGKKLVDPSGRFVSIAVVKKGSAPRTEYNVDGISGGTLTSNGVNDMLREFLGCFRKYFEKNVQPGPQPMKPLNEAVDSLVEDSLSASAVISEDTTRFQMP